MIAYREEIEPLRPYVPGRPIDDVKKEYGITEVVKIASNENPYGCSPKAKQAVVDYLDHAQLYPDGNCTFLRGAVAAFYHVKPEQLLFGSGVDEIIAMLGKVFVSPGDECITAAVTFSQYAASVQAMGGKMVYAPMKDHGYDLPAILSLITDKTKVIFITNPNNPTGTSYSGAEQLAFLQAVPSHILVVVDEAYAEFADRVDYPDTLAHMKRFPNVMLYRTFSKVYGLASMRIGYAVAQPDIIALFEKIRCPFNVAVPAQVAAVAALVDQDFMRQTAEKNKKVRDYMEKALADIGLYCIPSQANFVMVDTKQDSRVLFDRLMAKGYIIRPGVAFGMDTFLRVSLGTMEEMQGFIAALQALL